MIQQPVAYTVLPADPTQSQHSLFVSALTFDLPDAYGVKFAIDDGAPNEIIDFTGLTSGTFTNVPKGDRRFAAVIVDQDGEPLSDASLGQEDVNAGVGVGGRLLVAIGDSITNGVGDDRQDDNDSANGKNLNRGYPPILNDLLSSSWGADTAVFIANEGLGGTTTKEGRDRLAETIARYPDSQIWLILFGTNDSGGTMPVPSGVNCREPDSFDPTHPDYDAACRSTFKGYLRDMVLRLQSRNKIPALAQVPYVRNAPASRLNLILEYNQVVRDLHAFHHLVIEPPAFYDHFMESANHYLFFDNVHPNGSGYLDMAHMWHDNIMGSPLFE